MGNTNQTILPLLPAALERQPSNDLPATRLPAADAAEAEFRAGNGLELQGDPRAALTRYLAAVQLSPADPRYHRSAGVLLWQAGDRARGQWHLERAVALAPTDSQSHDILSQLYLESGDSEAAQRHAERALRLNPRNAEHAIALATVLESCRQTDAAWGLLRQVLANGYRSPRLAFVFGRMAGSLKMEADAVALIEGLMSSGAVQTPRQEASLRFLAAQLLDKLGRYDDAFAHARRANQLAARPYDPRQLEALVNRLIAYFTPDKFRHLPRATNGSRTPVFVVGMPRSGSTLVEQILSSHPAVHGAGEIGWLFNIATEAGRRGSAKLGASGPTGVHFGALEHPHLLDRLTLADLNELAAAYLTPLQAMNPSARAIIDKNLANFLQLGMIALLFPEARIIHCRRDPLDTCLSCYMNEFVAYDFSYDLRWIGHGFRQYERLMAHWHAVLPTKVLDVKYEQVVDDLEGQTRGMLQFLDLPWDPRCLAFTENARFVATASNEQVRRPLYKSSVHRWRHYEKHLGPLRAALGYG